MDNQTDQKVGYRQKSTSCSRPQKLLIDDNSHVQVMQFRNCSQQPITRTFCLPILRKYGRNNQIFRLNHTWVERKSAVVARANNPKKDRNGEWGRSSFWLENVIWLARGAQWAFSGGDDDDDDDSFLSFPHFVICWFPTLSLKPRFSYLGFVFSSSFRPQPIEWPAAIYVYTSSDTFFVILSSPSSLKPNKRGFHHSNCVMEVQRKYWYGFQSGIGSRLKLLIICQKVRPPASVFLPTNSGSECLAKQVFKVLRKKRRRSAIRIRLGQDHLESFSLVALQSVIRKNLTGRAKPSIIFDQLLTQKISSLRTARCEFRRNLIII